MKINYIPRIQNARTRFEAADLIRAHACNVVASLSMTLSAEDLIKNVIQPAQRYAECLERDYAECLETDEAQEPSETVWRQWLRDWGYFG